MSNSYSLAACIIAFWVYACIGQQLAQGLAIDCLTGPPGRQSLSLLNARDVAGGVLSTQNFTTWDFEGRSGVVRVVGGTSATLSCVRIVNATVAPPAVSSRFLYPTALDLSDASSLVIQSTIIDTDCDTILAYQSYLCASYRVYGSYTTGNGTIYFSSWQDGFTRLQNVTLSCPSRTLEPPCLITAVQTAQQLLQACTLYTAVEVNLTIIVAANISITKGSWSSAPVLVHGNLTLVGALQLERPLLDFNLMVHLWDLLPSATVLLINLTCVNLAPTYFSPAFQQALFSPLTERVWAFRRYQRQFHVINSTLVVPADELLYTRFWITFLVSPVPETKAKAAWLNVIHVEVLAVNDSGVYYRQVSSYTSTYTDVRITSSLDGYPLLPQSTGLQQLLDEEVPLSAVRQVINASDLRLALGPNVTLPDSRRRRWQLLVGNFSLSDLGRAGVGTSGPNISLALPGSVVIERGPGLDAVRLGFGWLVGVLRVPNRATLTLQQIILSELAQRSATYDPQDPLAALASPLWGAALNDDSAAVLENCTLLVSPRELALLQRVLLPADQLSALPAVNASFDASLLAAVRAFFNGGDGASVLSYSPSNLTVDSASTSRYDLLGVTFRVPVPEDGGPVAADITVPAAAASASADGSGGSGGVSVGAIVGGVVGGVALLVVLTAGVLFVRRRRRQRAAGSAGDPGQSAYEKYLRSGGELGDRPTDGRGGGAGGGSDLVHPSQELTNSSQVLRPGARSSLDLTGPGAGRLLKQMDSTPGSASASGGLGAAIPTNTSTTVLPSNELTGSGRTGPTPVPGGSGSASTTGSGLRPQAARSPATLSSATNTTSAAVSGLAGSSRGDGAGGAAQTDSFERPPSASHLGQHGSVPRTIRDSAPGATLMTSTATMTTTVSSGQQPVSPRALASGGGTALDQMHQMIHALGRDFNDKQLEINGVLGKGAHGTVYKGRWRGLPVAVKSMIFCSESTVRQQQRPLMEAAISSNLAHPNIVTTYSYELREVEHELASLSPELARQGGGWRLLIIQEYCDAGALRRIVDCGFFLTPAKTTARGKLKRLAAAVSGGVARKDSTSTALGGMASESSVGGAAAGLAAAVASTTPTATATVAAAMAAATAAGGSSRGSSGSSGHGATASTATANEAGSQGASRGGGNGSGNGGGAVPSIRPHLDDVPADVPPRPASSLQAALRYVEAALMVARGLQHIHEKNIVHGDLNPNNVLLVRASDTAQGFRLKVADFGLSVRMSEGESHLSGLWHGSPYYCAPEVVLSGKIGKPADIYSLGIMLWELQNGLRPAWRMGIRLRTYPSLNTAELEFGPDTPPRYVRLARDCFHGSKDARPNVAQVVETLAGILAELETVSRGV